MLAWCSGSWPRRYHERKKPVGEQRLGIHQLGPYAYEEQMPVSLSMLLSSPEQAAAEERSPAAIPLLKPLSDLDPSVEKVFFCNASVKHISKNPAEGNQFCAYRNIQMQLSYISEVSPLLDSTVGLPSILTLQDLIEEAWDCGINSDSRLQTGGIRGTRKHIGTREAQSLLKGLKLTCKVNAFHGIQDGKKAHIRLLDFVENYYSPKDGQVVGPIFLQQPHHSSTIIGIELLHDRSRRLLVFDPASPTPQNVLDSWADHNKIKHLSKLMKPYRRTESQLAWFRDFETLFVVP